MVRLATIPQTTPTTCVIRMLFTRCIAVPYLDEEDVETKDVGDVVSVEVGHDHADPCTRGHWRPVQHLGDMVDGYVTRHTYHGGGRAHEHHAERAERNESHGSTQPRVESALHQN